jgi:hypothetical protein
MWGRGVLGTVRDADRGGRATFWRSRRAWCGHVHAVHHLGVHREREKGGWLVLARAVTRRSKGVLVLVRWREEVCSNVFIRPKLRHAQVFFSPSSFPKTNQKKTGTVEVQWHSAIEG